MRKLFGTGVALVTPFKPSGEIDFTALRRLLKHTATGVDYYVVMGTTGESATLTKDEKAAVLDFVKKNNEKGLPLVYGLGGNYTAAIIAEIEQTNLRGVSALLSVSPYYNKPSQAGICEHFKAVADNSPVPLILYNVPGRTSSNLTAETTLKLAAHKNIVGIKEASGNMEQCIAIAKHKPKDFMLISGDDLLTLPLYAIGAVGVISVLANAYPVVFRNLYQFALAGRYAKAQQELFRLTAINGPMYEEGNPVGIKSLLAELRICGPDVRLPLVKASRALQAKIRLARKGVK